MNKLSKIRIENHAADIHELEFLQSMSNIRYKAKTTNNVSGRITAESISQLHSATKIQMLAI